MTAPNGISGTSSELGLFEIGDGKIRSMELFAVDQLDRAIARFEELERRPATRT